jgi:hypothetical protein
MSPEFALNLAQQLGGISQQATQLAGRHAPSAGGATLETVSLLLGMAQQLNAVVADCQKLAKAAAGVPKNHRDRLKAQSDEIQSLSKRSNPQPGGAH